ncbi:hypothetical protein ACFQBQ_10030 [Granulicella cerasi]|uniref:DUF4126 domain-containing protein n=1 Tax=Granulicella cerasi TaxID=741063 RepID=A0ABW1Z9W7_9BACT|nr:hypothetical protein [Granulicella cerasi]
MLSALLFGIVSGSRTFTGIMVLSWFVLTQRIPMQHSRLQVIGGVVLVAFFTLAALSEWIYDVMPFARSRKELQPRIARLCTGGLCGAVSAAAIMEPIAGGVILGLIGATIGTQLCFGLRQLFCKWFGRDLPAGLLESAIFLGFAVLSAVLLRHDAIHSQAIEMRMMH